MNSINLVGRLGRDPEVRYFETGTVVASVSLAVRGWSREDGEHTDWFDLEVWGKQAQTLADRARKGDQIGVTGRMVSSTFEGRDGGKRTKWVVKVSAVDLLSPKQDGPRQPTPDGGVAAKGYGAPSGAPSPHWDEAAIPF